jgi:hypothetical protein
MIRESEAANAVQRMTALQYFPTTEAAHAEIMDMLLEMVSEPEHLEWLLRTMRDQVGKWHGTKELRGVLCTKFAPRDGIEAYSELPGFTPADIERENLTEHKQLTADHHLRGLTGAEVAGLIAAPIEPVTDEERAAIDALAAKLEARSLATAAEK